MKNNKTLFSTTLIIIGETLEPAEISEILELRPNQEWERGQNKEIKIGKLKKKFKTKHDSGGWKKFISATERRKSLEKQIQYWIDLLSPKKKGIKKIQKQGNKIILDCFIGCSGAEFITLNADIMGQLASMGISLDVSYYPD